MIKTILITGANRGLGYEAAKQLAVKGHTVLLAARDLQAAKEAAAQIEGTVYPFQLDITNEAQIRQLVEVLKKQFGTIDVLINNAGANLDEYREIAKPNNPLDTPLTVIRKSFECNFFGHYAMIQCVLPLLQHDRRADIMLLSSGMGQLSSMGVGSPGYRFSKVAVNALSAYLGVELTGTNLYVNAVDPGWCRTDLGGPSAPLSVEEGVGTLLWLVEDEPLISGKLLFNKKEQSF